MNTNILLSFSAILSLLSIAWSDVQASTNETEPFLNINELKEITIEFRRGTIAGFLPKVSYQITFTESGWRTDNNIPIKQTTVKEFVDAFTHLRPSDRELSCLTRYDDDRSFHIRLKKSDSLIRVTSSSNCGSYAPWNVVENRILRIQNNGAIGRAVVKMLMEIEPYPWKREAKRQLGQFGTVDLIAGGKPTPGLDISEPIDRPYRQTISHHAQYRQVFHDTAPVINSLECDLSKSPDCHRVKGLVSARWGNNINLVFPVYFDGDSIKKIELPHGAEKQLAELDRSKLISAYGISSKNEPLKAQFGNLYHCSENDEAIRAYEASLEKNSKLSNTQADCPYLEWMAPEYQVFSFSHIARITSFRVARYYYTKKIAVLNIKSHVPSIEFARRLGVSEELLVDYKSRSNIHILSDLDGNITELPHKK